jgi:hypothetical protein
VFKDQRNSWPREGREFTDTNYSEQCIEIKKHTICCESAASQAIWEFKSVRRPVVWKRLVAPSGGETIKEVPTATRLSFLSLKFSNHQT